MRRIIPALAWLVLAVGGVVFPDQGPGGSSALAQTAKQKVQSVDVVEMIVEEVMLVLDSDML